ncbi:MAG: hypothetical protein U0325_22075 [Polyangiales bacterium]
MDRQPPPSFPYRAPVADVVSVSRARVRVPMDLLAVVLGVAALSLLRYWPAAVDLVATAVLGFPSLHT